MSIFDKIKSPFPFSFSIKGVDKNRAEMPRTTGGAGYSGYSGDYYGDLLSAIQGIDLKGGGKLDFIKEAGDLRMNSIVSICLNWIATTWAQAPVSIGTRSGALVDPDEGADKHPAVRLLRRPNAQYTGKWLTWALLNDWWPTGNAYAHIVTNGRNNLVGEPVELEWLPAAYTLPKADRSGHLSYYEYRPNGTPIPYDPKEIVHFRFGIDPINPLLGLSPLLAQARYIVADNAGGAYSAGLLHNGGIPPALLVPQAPTGAANAPGGVSRLTPEDAETLTTRLKEKFRDEPGQLVFLSQAVQLLMLGYKPSEMALNDLMEEPETRIPAAFGIPPEVLKLRIGLVRSTTNNIGESHKMGWQDCLVPNQDLFADDWTEQLLLRRFEGTPEDKTLFYDRREVGVLKPDKSADRKDAQLLFTGGVIDRYDAKVMAGQEADEKLDKGVYRSVPTPGDPNNPGNPDDPKADPKPPAQKKTLIDTRP